MIVAHSVEPLSSQCLLLYDDVCYSSIFYLLVVPQICLALLCDHSSFLVRLQFLRAVLISFLSVDLSKITCEAVQFCDSCNITVSVSPT